MSRLLPALRELFSSNGQDAARKAIRANLTPAWHASQLVMSLLWVGGVYLVVSTIKPRARRDANPRQLQQHHDVQDDDVMAPAASIPVERSEASEIRGEQSISEMLVRKMDELDQRLRRLESTRAESNGASTDKAAEAKHTPPYADDYNKLMRSLPPSPKRDFGVAAPKDDSLTYECVVHEVVV